MPSPPSVANLMGNSLSDESTVYTRTHVVVCGISVVAPKVTSIVAAISSALYNYYFSLAYRDCNHCHSVTGLINRGQSNGS